jgi:hypothetical protein
MAENMAGYSHVHRPFGPRVPLTDRLRRRAGLLQGVHGFCRYLVTCRGYLSEGSGYLCRNAGGSCRSHQITQQFLILNADDPVLHETTDPGLHFLRCRAGHLGCSITGYPARGLLDLAAATQNDTCGQEHQQGCNSLHPISLVSRHLEDTQHR